MTDTVMVTPRHMRLASYCATGTRAWFARQWPDDWRDRWHRFRHGGLPAEDFERAGDAMAIQLAQVAREDAESGR